MLLSLTAQILIASPASCHAPVAPSKSHVSSEYGARSTMYGPRAKKQSSKTEHHSGIDIVARVGTPVVNALDGRVLVVSNDRRGSKVVYVRSVLPNRRYLDVYYGHLDASFVKEGDLVFAGEKIGTVGKTGTFAPHLHITTKIYFRDTGARKEVNPRAVINFCKYEYRHHDYYR